MRKIFVMTILGLLCLTLVNSAQATGATLSLGASNTSVNAGQSFSVSIKLNTGGSLVDAVDINALHFNPSVLQVVDSNVITAGIQITPSDLFPSTTFNSVDNTNGIIKFSQSGTGGTSFSSSGTLATINFHAVAAGVSNITFDFTPGSTVDTNVAFAGNDILASVSNLQISVINPAAGLTIGNVRATASSSSVVITWTTNEPATSQVEYGLTTAYGKTSSLNRTRVTAHSVKIRKLKSNTLYHFRVDSKDSAGHVIKSQDFTFHT